MMMREAVPLCCHVPGQCKLKRKQLALKYLFLATLLAQPGVKHRVVSVWVSQSCASSADLRSGLRLGSLALEYRDSGSE